MAGRPLLLLLVGVTDEVSLELGGRVEDLEKACVLYRVKGAIQKQVVVVVVVVVD